jgi:hypothetical protein
MNATYAQTTDLIEAPDLHTATGSGRPTWDERGNSIWEWQTAPGVYSREISPQQLRALESNELHLIDGVQHFRQEPLWSRSAHSRINARSTHVHELVMPMRANRPAKSSGFDNFLKLMGLPA